MKYREAKFTRETICEGSAPALLLLASSVGARSCARRPTSNRSRIEKCNRNRQRRRAIRSLDISRLLHSRQRESTWASLGVDTILIRPRNREIKILLLHVRSRTHTPRIEHLPLYHFEPRKKKDCDFGNCKTNERTTSTNLAA